jgi:hypothetical protein
MSHKHLGEVFDIHGGGIDLVFPHHENEIAQTRCAFGHDVMAKVWMHNGFLQVEGEKMSKSLGNFITIHDLLHSDKFGGKAWKGEVLRLAMMRSHYRQPIDWTVKALEEAEKTLARWYGVLRAHGLKAADAAQAPLRAAFVEALCDDLNIPRAMAELHALAAKAEPRDSDSQTTKAEAEKLARAASLLGLLQDDPTTGAHKAPEVNVDAAEVEKLVAERLAARAAAGEGPPTELLREHELLDTGGSVLAALPLLGADPFFVVNGDAFWVDGPHAALARLAEAFDPAEADGVLLVHRTFQVHAETGFGDFALDKWGAPRRRGEREVVPYIYAGAQIVAPALLDGAPAPPFSMNACWDRAIAAGRLRAVVHDGLWFHLSTPLDLADAESILALGATGETR